MGAVYESLKVRMQDTLRGKTNSVSLPRVKGNSALSLNDELEELERLVADRIGRLKAAVKEGEAVVASEAENAEQLVEGLKANIAALEAELRDTEEADRRKESDRQKTEEHLVAKIDGLENELQNKDKALESRGNEMSDLKSKIDGQAKRIAELEMAGQKAKGEAVSEAQRAEHLAQSSKAKVAALEGQLRETEEILRQKESIIKGLEQNLNAKTQEFQNQVRNKEELLAARDAEMNDLKSQLKVLTKGIEEMSSFFRQAEALAAIEGQPGSKGVVSEPSNSGEKNPVALQRKPPEVVATVPDAAAEIVSPDLFNRIIDELTEVMGVMRPIASIIVRDHVAALDESMQKFPKARLPELLESLSREILDENLKVDFRERLIESAQIDGEGSF